MVGGDVPDPGGRIGRGRGHHHHLFDYFPDHLFLHHHRNFYPFYNLFLYDYLFDYLFDDFLLHHYWLGSGAAAADDEDQSQQQRGED